jgi:hypothetical protein
MTSAFNKVTLAWLDDIGIMTLTPPEQWVINPIFDDPIRAFEVGPTSWVISGNNIHVLTQEELDVEPVKLQEAKESKRAEINELRNFKISSGYTDSNNITWGNSASDIQNLNAVCTLIALGVVTGSQTWRDSNNINHDLTPTELVTLAASIAVFVKMCYLTSWAHKENIDALTTVSAVLAYNYTINWP